MAASTEQLHTHAIEAEKHAEQLATGLGEMGADPGAVKAVSQCADLLRKISVALAKGMKEEQPSEPEPANEPQTMDQALDQHMAARRPA